MVKLILVATALGSLLGAGAVAPPAAHAQDAAAATLSVLAPPVTVVPAGARKGAPAVPGADLADGDRVVTGRGGLALVTFLDGTTVTVQPESDVTVRRREASPEGAGVQILITVGKVWARAARLLGRQASVSLQSNEYAATAHDGLIGAERTRDGRFVCWTRAGQLALAAADGRRLAVLGPGQKATVAGQTDPVVEPFQVHASVLEVRTPPGVAPLVVMPDGARVAGFPAPGVETNLVFGSLTERTEDGWHVEVPAGETGRYTIVLVALTGGPFTARVSGAYRGQPVYAHHVSGVLAAGERWATVVEPRFAEGTARKATTARVETAWLEPLGPGGAVLPAHVPGAGPVGGAVGLTR